MSFAQKYLPPDGYCRTLSGDDLVPPGFSSVAVSMVLLSTPETVLPAALRNGGGLSCQSAFGSPSEQRWSAGGDLQLSQAPEYVHL